MERKHPLICARPGCGYLMWWTETAPLERCRCERCDCLTAFTLTNGKMIGVLVAGKPRRRKPLGFDDLDRLIRNNHGIDGKKC